MLLKLYKIDILTVAMKKNMNDQIIIIVFLIQIIVDIYGQARIIK